MEYLTTKQAAELWDITANRITILAKNGRIRGAIHTGSQWLIPKDAKKPDDGRTRNAKIRGKDDVFRFPFYVNASKKSYNPPLSPEEAELADAQIAFYSCDFEKSKTILDRLLKSTENIYIRISVLFFECIISAWGYGGVNFDSYHADFFSSLNEDFPHKKDMEIFIPMLYSYLGQYNDASDSLIIEPEYNYSPSVRPMISYMSLYHFTNPEQPAPQLNHLAIYEVTCSEMEKEGYCCEAHDLHFMLALIYSSFVEEKHMYYHIRKALDIACSHGFIMIMASYMYYYREPFEAVLPDYPAEFGDKLRQCSNLVGKSFEKFKARDNTQNLYASLPHNSIRLILYSLHGYSNKKIAEIMNISERTVANHFSKLYAKFDVKNRHELNNVALAALGKKH